MNCIEPTECLATVSISRRNNLRLLRALNMSNLSTSSSFSSLHSPTSHDSRPVVANPSTFLREGTGGLEPDNSLTSFETCPVTQVTARYRMQFASLRGESVSYHIQHYPPSHQLSYVTGF